MNENEPLLFTVSLCLQLSSQMFLLNVKVPVNENKTGTKTEPALKVSVVQLQSNKHSQANR